MKWFLPDEHVLAADFAVVHGVVPVNRQERRLVEEHFAKVHHHLPKFMSKLFLLDKISQLESEVDELRLQLYDQTEETAELRSELIRHAMLIDLLVRRLEGERRDDDDNDQDAEEQECENQVQEILFRRRLELAKLALPEEYEASKRHFGSNRASSDGNSQHQDTIEGDQNSTNSHNGNEADEGHLETVKSCNQQPEMADTTTGNPKKRLMLFGSGDADTLSSSVEGIHDTTYGTFRDAEYDKQWPV